MNEHARPAHAFFRSSARTSIGSGGELESQEAGYGGLPTREAVTWPGRQYTDLSHALQAWGRVRTTEGTHTATSSGRGVQHGLRVRTFLRRFEWAMALFLGDEPNEGEQRADQHPGDQQAGDSQERAPFETAKR